MAWATFPSACTVVVAARIELTSASSTASIVAWNIGDSTASSGGAPAPTENAIA